MLSFVKSIDVDSSIKTLKNDLPIISQSEIAKSRIRQTNFVMLRLSIDLFMFTFAIVQDNKTKLIVYFAQQFNDMFTDQKFKF